MKMMISRDRLREKIMADSDLEIDAGCPAHILEGIEMFLSPEVVGINEGQQKLKEAFGLFIRQLRRREGLSTHDLSEKARIEEGEVHKIEHDPHYTPRPRTVHQLATVFKLPERALMKLSGATITQDTAFQNEAYRFAAKSDGISKLNSAEQKALNEYIKFLAHYNGA